MSGAEDIRAAIARYLASRRADSEFTRRLHKRIEEDRNILDRLADEEVAPACQHSWMQVTRCRHCGVALDTSKPTDGDPA